LTAYTDQSSPILDTKDACVFLKRSRSSLFQSLNPNSRYFDPSFPKPFKFGARAGSNAWRKSDLVKWVDDKATNAQTVQGSPPSDVAANDLAGADDIIL